VLRLSFRADAHAATATDTGWHADTRADLDSDAPAHKDADANTNSRAMLALP